MGYDLLMSNADERIEVRGMRGPPLFNFDLGQPESDAIDLLPTDVRSANLPWEPDSNA
jgi:hypothetical protein